MPKLLNKEDVMYNSWQKDLSDSSRAILSIKDDVLPMLISGNLHSIENSENEILLMFDKTCGVDLIREDKNGLQGIASRVQFGNNWDTFTIRHKRHTGTKTEMQKRIEQIKNGYFYPAFTLQAYFDNRKQLNLLSIAIVKTVDLYNFVKTHQDKVKQRCSDNIFKYVKWADMKKAGVEIKIYRPENKFLF